MSKFKLHGPSNDGTDYEKDCVCHMCQTDLKFRKKFAYMVLCPICGNKRCPKASNHELGCTDSNNTGQTGSIYE